ncbi:hypothetical protein CC79DRAFT_1319988 [Sarocladium strictum]
MVRPPTFGVELEFLIPHALMPNPPAPGNMAQSNELGINYIARKMQIETNHPIAVQCLCFQADGGWTAAMPCRIAGGYHKRGSYRYRREPPIDNGIRARMRLSDTYFIQADAVVPLGLPGWSGMEIATRVLPTSDIYVPNGGSELRRFLNWLVNWQGPKIGVTDLCGLHVHIGEPSRGVTPLVAKRLATLIVLLERGLLETLVSPQRPGSTHWLPVRTDSRLAARGPLQNINNLTGILPPNFVNSRFWFHYGAVYGTMIEGIWQCITAEDVSSILLERTGGTKCLAGISVRDQNGEDSLSGNRLPAIPRSCTLELRYSEATMCPDFISMWVEIGARLMTICRSGNPTQFGLTVNGIVNIYDQLHSPAGIPGGLTLPEALLGAIGLNASVARCTLLVGEHSIGIDRSLLNYNPGVNVRLVR